jgi:hypothetical protein
MQTADIKAEILQHVDNNWREIGRPLLLSKLGSLLGPGRLEIEAATGLKLKPFVTFHLRDDCQILENPNDPNIIGLVPRGVTLSDDVSFYFAKTPSSAGAPPRYRPSFWAAFAKPIPPDTNRYIRMMDLRFFDQPETAPPPEGMLQIKRESIPPEDMLKRDAAIQLSVDHWLSEHGISRSTVLVPGAAQSLNAPGPEIVRNNLLEALIGALDEGELRRFDLPMDLVAKLFRTRLR